jgi:hypothetical protein
MIYDQFGIDARRDYDLFIFALTGRYLALIAPGVPVTPMSIGGLQNSGMMLRQAYLQSSERLMMEYMRDYPSEQANSLANQWRTKLARFTMENISSLVLRMKGADRSEFSLLGNAHGAVGQLLQAKLTEPQYEITTASGRRYKASPLMEAEARDFAYRIWLQANLHTISQQGDLAEVVYPSPNHEGNGRVFSISGQDSQFPSFADIESYVFHYNATAMVKPYVLS